VTDTPPLPILTVVQSEYTQAAVAELAAAIRADGPLTLTITPAEVPAALAAFFAYAHAAPCLAQDVPCDPNADDSSCLRHSVAEDLLHNLATEYGAQVPALPGMPAGHDPNASLPQLPCK
jgi:hypothetical protein